MSADLAAELKAAADKVRKSPNDAAAQKAYAALKAKVTEARQTERADRVTTKEEG